MVQRSHHMVKNKPLSFLTKPIDGESQVSTITLNNSHEFERWVASAAGVCLWVYKRATTIRVKQIFTLAEAIQAHETGEQDQTYLLLERPNDDLTGKKLMLNEAKPSPSTKDIGTVESKVLTLGGWLKAARKNLDRYGKYEGQPSCCTTHVCEVKMWKKPSHCHDCCGVALATQCPRDAMCVHCEWLLARHKAGKVAPRVAPKVPKVPTVPTVPKVACVFGEAVPVVVGVPV